LGERPQLVVESVANDVVPAFGGQVQGYASLDDALGDFGGHRSVGLPVITLWGSKTLLHGLSCGSMRLARTR
jgi:hypothetical protein